MQKLTLPLSLVAILAGCAGANPQTREEFRSTRQAGVPFSFTDTYIAKRPFDEAVDTLRKKVDECFQVNVTTKRTQGPGGFTTMNVTDEYRTVIRSVDKNLAELTTQYHMKGAIVMQQVPAGGFYLTVMDIERLTATTTKLSYYGSSFAGSKAKWNAFKQWSDGQLVPCP